MAGTIIADTIQATSQQISLNVGNTTILTASSTGLTLIPTTNVNINVTNSNVTLTNANITTANITGVATFSTGSAALPSITTAGDTNTGIFFSAADTIDFAEGGVATGQFDSSGNFKFNSGYGSVATAYGCRAWVNFNGATGTIRASGGISSITRNGAGDYTATFSFTMPDINYSVSGSAMYATGTNAHFLSYGDFNGQATNPQTTTTFRFRSLYTGTSVATPQDCGIVTFAVFR